MLHQLDSLPVAMLDLAEKMIMKILGDSSTPKGTETPGAEELKLLVEILRKRAAHPSSPVALKCELLERALNYIRDLSTRYRSSSFSTYRAIDPPQPLSMTILSSPEIPQLSSLTPLT